MEYKFFDKQFLVMPDANDIIGKKVFYRDTLTGIINEVENGDVDSDRYGVLESIVIGSAHPFYIDDVYWSLAYYDPNYECKVAFSQGKQIQFRGDNTDGWVDAKEPTWSERLEYRIKPDAVWYVHQDIDGHYWKSDSDTITIEFKGTEAECDAWITEHTPKTGRMTNRELTRWLADGKGERLDVVTKYVSTHYVYTEGRDNEACDEDIRIREWGSNQWHEPLVEVKE
jgi:hypothetical protein